MQRLIEPTIFSKSSGGNLGLQEPSAMEMKMTLMLIFAFIIIPLPNHINDHHHHRTGLLEKCQSTETRRAAVSNPIMTKRVIAKLRHHQRAARRFDTISLPSRRAGTPALWPPAGRRCKSAGSRFGWAKINELARVLLLLLILVRAQTHARGCPSGRSLSLYLYLLVS